MFRLVRVLQLVFYSLRIGQMLGAGRAVRGLRHYLAHHRLIPYWLVTGLAFAVPWGWQMLGDGGVTASIREAEECRVNRVVDGDGVRLDCGPGRRDLNVRLYCIDAPETEQEPWGERSTRHLRKLVGPTVLLVDHGAGRWGRTIGQIFTPEGEDLNLAMVGDGWAPVYPQHCDERAYYRAEEVAQRARRGVWSEPGAHQRPWEWRR
ncbi:thermonuclease family protein [Aquisalimonas sp. 2447]|uniref:thermonuclease family protein n=1 Tax=Aquisalimonas sp. 2447 TaxID=2740807 RepID=UPI0014325905|nr:thermonuclease family protein [Aquisalimonas sp. 2447]QIT54111.1 thermonuclease family protein [Aquisalimonas sp. 2447]